MKKIFALILLMMLISCAQLPRRYTTGDPLTREEIIERNKRIYEETFTKIQNGKIRFEGSDGLSESKAIKIAGARNTGEGIAAENIWIAKKHGERDVDWNKVKQSLDFSDDMRRKYDIIEIEIVATGKMISYFFDITSFFGKH